jgi:Tat protein translocase TatB subunit
VLNPFEILLILAVALIVLGPERLPEVMKAAGKIMRELRLASNTVLREMSDVLEDDASRTPPPSAVTRAITQEMPTVVTAPIAPESTPENRTPEKP